jgi:hypothetical protein
MNVYDDITTRALIVIQAVRLLPDVPEEVLTAKIFDTRSNIFLALQELIDNPDSLSKKNAVLKIIKLEM